MNPQTNPKTTKKSTKNPPKWLQNRSWRLSWAPLGASWGVLAPSWRQDGPKSQKYSKIGIVLSLVRSQVGTKCHQNPTPKPFKKNSTFGRPPDRFWVEFGSQVGPQQGKPLFQFSNIFGSWAHLGAKTAPRRPKKPQEAPKTASKTDFGAIFVDSWLIFWWFFGWFGVHFGSCCLID